jgi:hypothetical protein
MGFQKVPVVRFPVVSDGLDVAVLGLAGLDLLAQAPESGGIEHLDGRLLGFVEETLGNDDQTVEQFHV